MSLNLLTQRAQSVFLKLPRRSEVLGVTIVNRIKKEHGVGNLLLNACPDLKFSKLKKIDVKVLVQEAYYQSIKLEHPYVGTEHILLAVLKLLSAREFGEIKLKLLRSTPYFNVAKLTTGEIVQTPMLSAFSEDMNYDALKTMDKPFVVRKEYDELLASLLLKNSPHVLLVGESGVGRKTLVKMLARDITFMNIPKALAGCKILEFDLLAFMTGTFSKTASVDMGLDKLVNELKSVGKVILLVKDFQNLFFSTTTGLTMPMFFSLFIAALRKSEVRVIASVTGELYDKVFVDNKHLIEDFTVINVNEPDEAAVSEILKYTGAHLEEEHGITISSKVVDYIYEKSVSEGGDLCVLKRALMLLDRSCAHLLLKEDKLPVKYKNLVDKSYTLAAEMEDKLFLGLYDDALILRDRLGKLDVKLIEQEKKLFSAGKGLVLTTQHVDIAVAGIDGSDFSTSTSKALNITATDLTTLTSLNDRVKKRIIGQEQAVETVIKGLIRAKMGLRSKNRPLGNFLFLGPTGVGKTELAKVLAKEFFGEKTLIRLDMSDFGEKHNVARLVGAPPGYVGYGEGGELTSKIRNKPDSVVLFDEIEKAHPDVLNILLQIMEEGELTDAKGVSQDFSQAVVVLTSNLGTDILHDGGIGFAGNDVADGDVEKRLKHNLKKILKPELLNRFDEIITFVHLTKSAQLEILNLLLEEVQENLKKQDIKLVVRKTVKNYLLGKGYSREYGARALRRVMERELLDRVAEFLLKNDTRPLKLIARLEKDRIIVAPSL